MPVYENQQDKSQENPRPLLGLEALAKMSPPQADSVILRAVEMAMKRIQELENRIKYLEKYETNSSPPVRTVTGDAEFIKVTQSEEHVLIAFDEDEMKRHMPPPLLPVYLDRYRHCTDPNANPDIYLPSGIADSQIDPDGVLVLKVGFDTGAQKCYYIIERNVLGAPTSFATQEKVTDCTECEDVPDPTPEPPDPPDGDYPYFNGWVVADFSCMLDAAGDLIIVVKYVNLQTGEIKFENKRNCCCDTAPGTVPMDRWRPCDAISGGDDSQDIFLPTVMLDMADAADPVIQVGESGCCYRFVEETADETLTEDDIWVRDTCDDEECDPCDPPITTICDDCQGSQSAIAATNIESVQGDNGAVASNPITPYAYTSYTNAGGNDGYWLWTSGTLSGGSFYQIQMACVGDKVYARLGDSAGFAPVYYGEYPGTNLTGSGLGNNWHEVTGDMSCVNGVITGTFDLYNSGGDKQIRITLP